MHATDHKTGWVECQGSVSSALWNNKSPASIGLFPSLLEKIPILLFAGAEDLICNHKGIERLVERLEWNGGKGLGVSRSHLVVIWVADFPLACSLADPTLLPFLLADRQSERLVRERHPRRHVDVRAEPDLRQGRRVVAHGRLRRPSSRARHDPQVHGRRLFVARRWNAGVGVTHRDGGEDDRCQGCARGGHWSRGSHRGRKEWDGDRRKRELDRGRREWEWSGRRLGR